MSYTGHFIDDLMKTVEARGQNNFEPAYFLRVHPEARLLLKDGLGHAQELTPLNAVASTFGLTGKQYLERLVAQT